MYIEKGIDKNGVDMWFILEDANLVKSFYSEQEAFDYIDNL